MVSGFFSGGAADQFLKEGRLDEVQERTDIMGRNAVTALTKVQNQAEQFTRTNRIADLKTQNDNLLQLDKFFALRPDIAAKPSMQQSRATLVKLIDGLSTAVNRSSTTGLSPALGAAAAGTPAAEAGAERAATEAQDITVRDVPQPDGSVKTTVLKGGQPIGELGQGFKTQVQPTEIPGATPKDVSRLDEAEIATRSALRVSADIKNLVKTGGASALSSAGALSSGTASLLSNVEGVAELAGIDTTKFQDGKATLNKDVRADTILGRMKEAANINAEMKSAIVNLAFSAALASGQSGKGVSDKDYERFVKELGAGAASPERFTAVLTAFENRLNENFKTRFRVQSRRIKALKDKEPPDPLKELQAQGSDVSKMSDEELLEAIRNSGK